MMKVMTNMTQEDKDLLLKDLCARLPYGVIVNVKGFDFDFKDKVTQIYKEGYRCSIQVTNNMPYGIEQVKPYLFPLSSMTEEQYKEFYDKYCWNDGGDNFEMDSCSHYYALGKFDWLDKNHFDYRGLIPMGLANDATDKNIY